jgi:hypothetical protein
MGGERKGEALGAVFSVNREKRGERVLLTLLSKGGNDGGGEERGKVNCLLI